MNPLRYSDFIQQDDNNTIQQLIDYLDKLLKTYKETASLIKQQAKETADSIKYVGSATEEQRETILKATQAQEALLQKQKDLNSEERIAKREKLLLIAAKKEENQIDKLIVQINKSMEGTYDKLSAQYRLMKIVINQMTDAEKLNGKTKKELEADAKKLYDEMSKLQQNTGKYTLQVGHYQNALSGLPTPIYQATNAFKMWGENMNRIFTSDIPNGQKAMLALKTSILAVVAAVVALAKGMASVVKVNAEFEQQNANLATILGLTTKDIENLTDTALSLGRSTEWTASQVTQLQTELAKLGFGQGSIIAMQKHVLAFATAVGADLGEAATMAGATIRAFNYTSQDSERVMGTLAVAINKSALSFDRLKYAMGTVFPIANAFGMTIEDAAALLGTLANAGFSAESAATATRNMLLNLADANGKLAKRTGGAAKSFDDIIDKLVQLRKEGADLSEIFDLTDKRSVAAFNALMSGTENAKELRQALEDVNGELTRIQQQRLDTLQGQTTILKSYWEGLKLSFRESNGWLKEMVVNLQSFVSGLNKALFPAQAEQQAALDEYLESFTNFYGKNGAEMTKTYIDDVLHYYDKEINKLEQSENRNDKKVKERIETLKARYKGMAEAASIVREQMVNDEQERLRQEELARQEAEGKEAALTRQQKQQRLKDLQAVIDAIKMEINATEKGAERRKELYIDLANAERNLALEKNRQAEESAKIDENLINRMYDIEVKDAEKKYYNEVSKLDEEQLRKKQTTTQLEIAITEEGTEKMLQLRLKNIDIQSQIEIEQNRQKEEKLRQDEKEIRKKYDRMRIDEIKKMYLTLAKREIDAAQELQESLFNLDEHNEREKTLFRLDQEKKRLKSLLEMDKLAVDKMTDSEKAAIIAAIMEINAEQKKLGYNNIYEVFGISLNSQQQDALNTALDSVKDAIGGIADAWREAADAAVEAAEKQVDAAQKTLDAEIEARNQGYANNVETARKELEEAEKNRKRALRDQERAKNAQLNIDAVTQASSLTTATANIWKAFSGTVWGTALAVAATAAMWASFAQAQIKARQVTKYGEGTVEMLEGGSHASGNDIDLGYDKKTRKHRRAEGGEFFAVINKRNSQRFRDVIPDVIHSFNDGTFADKYMRASGNMAQYATQIIGGGTDISRLEKDVRAIKEQGNEIQFLDNEGRLVVKYKNLTRRIR